MKPMNALRLPVLLIGCLLCTLLAPARAEAQNIDLTTVPDRDEVQLTIYNSEDLTLVKERRALTFKKGLNRIQFSWAGTLIDPTSLDIRILTNTRKVEVLDTSYPPNRPQVLVWNIRSEVDGQQEVEIRYFISGITWTADYTVISNEEETELSMEGFVRVHNNSGETFHNAQVRLVVGVINLVEKIRDLAGGRVPPPGSKDYKKLRRAALEDCEKACESIGPSRPKQIVKEGLSEYFIYTIDGRETIPNGWSRRMRSFLAHDVDFRIEYRLREYEYGPQPVRFFIFENDEEHGLGTTPLPNGVIRLFRENGKDGLFYLATKNQTYVPIGDEIEVNLGFDKVVAAEKKVMEYRRENLVFGTAGHVVGWDDVHEKELKLSNYSEKDATVVIRLRLTGHVTFTGEGFALWDYQTVERTVVVEQGTELVLPYVVRTAQGCRAKQNGIVEVK